jgi:hypothetical protein
VDYLEIQLLIGDVTDEPEMMVDLTPLLAADVKRKDKMISFYTCTLSRVWNN